MDENAMDAAMDMTVEINVAKFDGIEMPYAKIALPGAAVVAATAPATPAPSKTFVLLPGLSVRPVSPMAQAVGAQYRAFLDAGYTIYVFDRRSNAPQGYTIRDMAVDTAACLEHLGVTGAAQVDIAGMSQGGVMAQYLAALNPQLVDHLMLCSTGARPMETMLAVADQWQALAQEKQEEQLVTSFGQLVYSEAVWDAAKDAVMAANSNITNSEFELFVIMAQSLHNFDTRDLLPSIQAKTLVVGSEGDRVMTPQASEELAELLNCEIFLYGPEFGHAAYDEAPDYVARLLSFCQR